MFDKTKRPDNFVVDPEVHLTSKKLKPNPEPPANVFRIKYQTPHTKLILPSRIKSSRLTHFIKQEEEQTISSQPSAEPQMNFELTIQGLKVFNSEEIERLRNKKK